MPVDSLAGLSGLTKVLKEAIAEAEKLTAESQLSEISETIKELEEAIRPGISTLDIDRLGEKLIRSLGGIPNFLHYNGYPASICVSVNDEVVHGIPSKHRILQEGDIVSLDAPAGVRR